MYEDLIKRLRKGLSCYGEKCFSCSDREHCVTHYEHDAADAIEELSVIVRAQKAVLDKFQNQNMSELMYTKENCPLCKYDELEYGDTLYQSNSWDGGVCYDSIRPVKFCPLCGRELPKEDEGS